MRKKSEIIPTLPVYMYWGEEPQKTMTFALVKTRFGVINQENNQTVLSPIMCFTGFGDNQ